MNRAIPSLLALSLIALTSTAREPADVPDGPRALDELVRRGVAAGALKTGPGVPGAAAAPLEVADAARLAQVVREARAMLTPRLVDELIRATGEGEAGRRGAMIAVLRTVGDELGDARPLAFAALRVAGRKADGLDAVGAVAAFREAIRHFGRLYPTAPGGDAAAEDLIARCVSAGALRRAGGAAGEDLAPGDPTRLELTVVASFARLTPAFRDALIARNRRTGGREAAAIAAVLRQVGRFTSDDRALALASAMTAEDRAGRGDLAGAVTGFREAAGHFLALFEADRRARGLEDLIARCVEAGGLLVVAGGSPGDSRLEPGDRGKLRQAVAANAALLTPELRDVLIGRKKGLGSAGIRGLVAMLRAIGEVGNDERALAHAQMIDAEDAWIALDIPRAIREYEGAAARFLAVSDRDRAYLCFNSLSILHRNVLSNYGEALAADRRALDILLAKGNADRVTLAFAQNGLGYDYYLVGQYDRAIEHYREALAMYSGTDVATALSAAVVWNNLGIVHHDRAEYALALEAHGRAYEAKRRAFGEGHPQVALALNNIAMVHASQGDYRRALEELGRSLATLEKSRDAKPSEIARAHHNLGSTYDSLGQYHLALDHGRKALEIRNQFYGPRNAEVASSLGNLGVTFGHLGDHDRALECFRDALAIDRRAYGGSHPSVALDLKSLAGSYLDLGDYEKAIDLYSQALVMMRRHKGEAHPGVGSILNGIGIVLGHRGEDRLASRFFRRALEIQVRAYGPGHPEIATIRDNLGSCLADLGEWPEAESQLRTALEARRKHFGERSAIAATSMASLASLQFDRGEYGRAIETFGQSLEIRRTILGERHPDVAQLHYNIGISNERLGRRDDARLAFERASEALRFEEGGGPAAGDGREADRYRPIPMAVDALRKRADAMEGEPGPRGPREQVALYEMAADLLDRTRTRIESEGSRLRIAETSFDLFPALIGARARLAAMDGGPEGLRAAVVDAERGTARAFLDTLGRARAITLGSVAPEVRGAERDLIDGLRDLDARIDEQSRRDVEGRDFRAMRLLLEERGRTEARLREFLARLEAENPRYAALRYPRPCTVEQAMAAIGPDEVGLVYVPGGRGSWLLALEPGAGGEGGRIRAHPMPADAEVRRLVATLTDLDTLEHPARAREAGAEGFRALLGPVADAIRGKGLVIVAGGDLGLLSFALLVEPDRDAPDDPDRGRFLAEGHGLRYSPSLTVLHHVALWEGRRQAPNRALWAIGDPIYGPADPRSKPGKQAAAVASSGPLRRERGEGDRAGAVFPRLEAAGREVRAIAEMLGAGPDEVRIGAEATEASIKRASASGELERHRFVHFATHGILGLDDGVQPSLVLATAGEPGDGQDGYLRLDEISALRLNADLVVLSACRTGQGRLRRGEGVSGLARSFLLAGSRGVVCSLWNVSDDAGTVAMMTDLYAGLARGQPATEALRDAQRARIAAGDPPRMWAPFILLGR